MEGAKKGIKDTMTSQDWQTFLSDYDELFDPESDKYIGMSFEEFTLKDANTQRGIIAAHEEDAYTGAQDKVEAAKNNLEYAKTSEGKTNFFKGETENTKKYVPENYICSRSSTALCGRIYGKIRCDIHHCCYFRNCTCLHYVKNTFLNPLRLLGRIFYCISMKVCYFCVNKFEKNVINAHRELTERVIFVKITLSKSYIGMLCHCITKRRIFYDRCKNPGVHKYVCCSRCNRKSLRA